MCWLRPRWFWPRTDRASELRVGVDDELRKGLLTWPACLGELTSVDDRSADALVIRSVTRVNRAFLEVRPCLKALATASSGHDHIDKTAMEQHGVAWTANPGCNADAVADWVELALAALSHTPSLMGIVGVGHVGSAVAARFPGRVLLCDPPRAKRDVEFPHVPFDELLSRVDTTRNMMGGADFNRFGGDVVLNAARGGVVHEGAAMGFIRQGGQVASDVFRGEPRPDPDFVAACAFATPHVAGYTAQAKEAALAGSLQWLAKRNGATLEPHLSFDVLHPVPADALNDAQAQLRRGRSFEDIRRSNLRMAL
jgi:erythronate-4-phosphate dehydrogenase